jgi:hypothetical protein
MKNLTTLQKGAVLLAAVLFFACTNPNNDDPNDKQGQPGITFSDGLPPGIWLLYVTAGTVNSKETYSAMLVGSDHVATAASSTVSGNTAALFEMPGKSFDENGTYTLVLTFSGGGGVKYAPSVRFINGSATIAFGGMIAL